MFSGTTTGRDLRVIKIGGYLFLGAGVAFLLYLAQLVPEQNRNWVDYLANTTVGVQQDTVFILGPVRDWTYGLEDTIIDKTWLQGVTIDPATIKDIWFVVEPFGKFALIGHTFITFELESGEAYSFSIEARREWGENYSAFSGLFRQYEIAYTWSTERDSLSRRVVKDGHGVRVYKLQTTASQRALIFTTAVTATNEVATVPRFYNTLTSNCTNLLASIINTAYPSTLPYHYSWNFPGASDRYLMEHGYITYTDTIESTMANANLLPFQDLLAEKATGSAVEFSTAVRTALLPE
jgi:Domain of unknown function (DUF4105)